MSEICTVQDVMNAVERYAPQQLAEDWDHVGLQIGTPSQEVTGVLTSLDVTEETVDKAIAEGCNMIVSHHPFLFGGVQFIHGDTPKGALIMKIIRQGLSVYAAHTNLDIAPQGLNDVVAQALGLQDIQGLVATSDTDYIGRIGSYESPVTWATFRENLQRAFPEAHLRFAGEWPTTVQTVGLCTGAGVSFMDAAIQKGATVYVTGDVKYHEAQAAREQGILLVDAGHYGTELVAATILETWIYKELAAQGLQIPVIADRSQRDFFLYE